MRTDLTRRQFHQRAIALGAAAAALPAGAQNFPSKPVTLIVPNAPGGAIDILARSLQQHLQTAWGQTVLVEYKPGAGTVVGTDFVAKAPADGHTLCLVATPHVINPAIRQMPFDTTRDLSGITILGISNVLLSVTPSLAVSTLPELIDLVKKNPGKFAYASPGSGSSMHFAVELLKQRTGMDLLHVPFKGSGPAYPEVMSGRIALLIDPLFSSLPHLKAGRLKPIAVTASRRSPLAPDIATMAETLPGFNVQSMFGMVVASATPRPVVQKIYADVVQVMRRPEVTARLSELGLEPNPIAPEQFDALIKSDIERWTQLVKTAQLKVD
ncbi:MAG: tripartite tricarboxylate transporter substrate binding protein [Betaproteobacteria bacterium]